MSKIHTFRAIQVTTKASVHDPRLTAIREASQMLNIPASRIRVEQSAIIWKVTVLKEKNKK